MQVKVINKQYTTREFEAEINYALEQGYENPEFYTTDDSFYCVLKKYDD